MRPHRGASPRLLQPAKASWNIPSVIMRGHFCCSPLKPVVTHRDNPAPPAEEVTDVPLIHLHPCQSPSYPWLKTLLPSQKGACPTQKPTDLNRCGSPVPQGHYDTWPRRSAVTLIVETNLLSPFHPPLSAWLRHAAGARQNGASCFKVQSKLHFVPHWQIPSTHADCREENLKY